MHNQHSWNKTGSAPQQNPVRLFTSMKSNTEAPGGDSKSTRFHYVNSPLIWMPMQWHKQEPLHFWVATKMDADWKGSLVVDSGVKRVLLAFHRQRASDGIKVVVLLVVDLLFSHKR